MNSEREVSTSSSASQGSISLAERLVGRVRNRSPADSDGDGRNVKRRTVPFTGDRGVHRVNMELELTNRRQPGDTSRWARAESESLIETYRTSEEAQSVKRSLMAGIWGSNHAEFARELFVAWSDLESILGLWVGNEAVQEVINYREESVFNGTSVVEGCTLVLRVYAPTDIPAEQKVMIFNYRPTTIADEYLIGHGNTIIDIHREILQRFLPKYTYARDTDIELIPMPAYIDTAVLQAGRSVETIEAGPDFLRLRTCIHRMDYSQSMDARWDNFPGAGNNRFHRSFLVYLISSSLSADETSVVAKITRARLLYTRGFDDRITTMYKEYKCYAPLPATMIISESSKIICVSDGPRNTGQISNWTHILSALDLRVVGRVGQKVNSSYFRRDLYSEIVPLRGTRYLDPYQISEEEDNNGPTTPVASPVRINRDLRDIFGEDSP